MAILRKRRFSLGNHKILRRIAGASSIVLLAGAGVDVLASNPHRGSGIAKSMQAAETRIVQDPQAGASEKKTSRIEGLVQTADGQGIAGVELTVQSVEVRGEVQTLVRRAAGTQDGKFSFPDLPAGKYLLRAEAPGFQPVTKEVILSEG